jgi:hypothetical protein
MHPEPVTRKGGKRGDLAISKCLLHNNLWDWHEVAIRPLFG